MGRMIVITLLACFLTTFWTLPATMEGKMKPEEIPVTIITDEMVLSELADLLSKQSGVTIYPVPLIADMKIEPQLLTRQSLAQVLDELGKKYGLKYKINEVKNAIVLFPAGNEFYETMTMMPSPRDVFKHDMTYARIAQAPPVTGRNYPVSHNTEEYKYNQDNKYQSVVSAPVSTFSIDVDTASYSNMRRFINAGQMPPPDAIRTEELLNYFLYDYPQPTGSEPFSLTSEVSACPWNPSHQLVMIGLQAKHLKDEELPPANLVFLIDVSGSMNEPNKLPLLKAAFKLLTQQLRDNDKVAIVVYAGKAGVALAPTKGSEKEKITAVIDALEAGGSTAGGEGIQLAYKLAKENFQEDKNNRVILATDGDFNVGVSSEGELTRLIEKHRDGGIFLNVLGFGTGNVKDNKMEALADKGNGVYSYIDNALEAKKVMVSQMAGTLFTIAKDVKLQVEFNPGKVKYYRLIGYENRVLDKQDFNDDKIDAGDMGAGHSVTAIYEIIPASSAETVGSVDPLLYQQTTVVPHNELLQVKVRYKKPNESVSSLYTHAVGEQHITTAPSDNFRFAAAVAEYGLLLHKSPFKGSSIYNQVLELAAGAKGNDKSGDRGEFIKLVEVASLLDEGAEKTDASKVTSFLIENYTSSQDWGERKLEVDATGNRTIKISGSFIDGGCIDKEMLTLKSVEKGDNDSTVVNLLLTLEGQPCKGFFKKGFQATLQVPEPGTYKVRLWLNERYHNNGDKLQAEKSVEVNQ